MNALRKTLLSATMGLSLAHPLWGQVPTQPSPPEPGRLRVTDQAVPTVISNQRVAEAIADCLRANGQVRHFRIDITYQNGNVELTGVVTTPAQREEVLRIVKSVSEVRTVSDRLACTEAGLVSRTLAQEPGPLPKKDGSETPLAPAAPGGTQEPMPIFQASPGQAAMGGQFQQPPPLPPYAWPTYAPYNNYSRVGYPTQLPYNAWPFIGPQYPFPKIPLGWRSVHLTYNDGHWWYGKSATGHDWWRVRYW